MARTIGPICVGLAVGSLIIGYGLGGRWDWMLIPGLLGGLWLFGYWRGWGWMASVGLIGFVGFSYLNEEARMKARESWLKWSQAAKQLMAQKI